jgi:hypothetical protein
MPWISPVYDRTAADVAFAKSQIAIWISESFPITYDLKGCLNTSDINRIEGNIRYLSSSLTKLGYPVGVVSKAWENKSLVTLTDVSRILNNISTLLSQYHFPPFSPNVPFNLKRHTEINDIEEILDRVKALLDIMIGLFPKCGTFQSGYRKILPMQR